ncbi:MAG: hypothetical protein ACRELF_29440, partial [Gemmataceae bacterium]
MASKQSIIDEIVRRVGTSSFIHWQIGITDDEAKRKGEWKDNGENVDHWASWQADSLTDAKDIETYFINEKKMRAGTDGDPSPDTT